MPTPTYELQFGTLDLSDAIDSFEQAVDTRLNAMVVPKRHGVLITEVPVLAGRVVRVKGRIQAQSFQVIRDTLDLMGRVLNSGRQKLRTHDDRYVYAYKQSFGYGYVPGSALCAADFGIDFLCDDPFWYEDTTQTQVVTLTAADTPLGGGLYGKDFSITNGGEVYVFINVQVDADQGGPVTKVYVNNQHSDRNFLYTGTILDGKSLVVDSGQFSAKNDGVEDLTNWSGYFLHLEKCTSNFRIEGSPATYTFSWTHRYY
jgi:hypothetical protein